jgi:hypothetical protein
MLDYFKEYGGSSLDPTEKIGLYLYGPPLI